MTTTSHGHGPGIRRKSVIKQREIVGAHTLLGTVSRQRDRHTCVFVFSVCVPNHDFASNRTIIHARECLVEMVVSSGCFGIGV